MHEYLEKIEQDFVHQEEYSKIDIQEKLPCSNRGSNTALVEISPSNPKIPNITNICIGTGY